MTAGVVAVEGSCSCSIPRDPADLMRRRHHIGIVLDRVGSHLAVVDRKSQRGEVDRSFDLEDIGYSFVGVGSLLVVDSSAEVDSLVDTLGCTGCRSRRGLTLW